MKLLLFQAADFAFSPDSLDSLKAVDAAAMIVVFIHAEPGDESRSDLIRKAAKNIKWLANKREIRSVCLHSFAHLAEEKAEPGFAESFMDELGSRLEGNGYSVTHTPFGKSNAWTLSVFQEPIAKVFKAL